VAATPGHRVRLANGLPGVAVSDAHSLLEVAVSYSVLEGDSSTPDGLPDGLATVSLVSSRASYLARLITPAAKLVQRARGNRRIRPTSGGSTAGGSTAGGSTADGSTADSAS
jgi:hypothetical protein